MVNRLNYKYTKAKLLIYASMIGGLGYTFYRSATISGFTKNWAISLLIAVVLCILFIEFVFRFFVKYFNRK